MSEKTDIRRGSSSTTIEASSPVVVKPKAKSKAASKKATAANVTSPPPTLPPTPADISGPNGNDSQVSADCATAGEQDGSGVAISLEAIMSQVVELMNSHKRLETDIATLKTDNEQLRKRLADIENKQGKVDTEAKQAKKDAESAKQDTAEALKKYTMTANRLTNKIEADEAKARARNIVIKNCKLQKTRGKPEELLAEATAYAQATLKELGCEDATILKATPHVLTHKAGDGQRVETIIIATLNSEEQAATTTDASFKKWQQAVQEAGGEKKHAKATPQVRRDLIKKAIAILDAMKVQKRKWQMEGHYLKASYDIVDGMPRLRVKEQANGRWTTWQTVEVGKDAFKFQPRGQPMGGQQGEGQGTV